MGKLTDTFQGDTPHLIASIKALLDLDARGALVPHGVGGHARTLLASAATRLLDAARSEAQPSGYDGSKSLGERLYESAAGRLVDGPYMHVPWCSVPAQRRAGWERAAVTFTASLSGGEEGLGAIPEPARLDLNGPSDGEEFLEFKEALSDLRSLRQEHRDLNGGGPGWSARNEAAWARVNELFANEDEAAWVRQQEDAHG